MSFIFTYHPSWLLLVFLLAAAGTFWLYYRAKDWHEISNAWRWGMAGFRFVTLSVIGILLLGIILEKLDQKTQKPIVFLLHDQSESIVQTVESTYYQTNYIKALK
ncbi:MAG: hypothetical protein R3279_04910 [Putridiphycobacter sp.]|nr:hypothetical protein [Putridiphycobacter sp.]